MTAVGATNRGDAISMLSRFLVDCGPFLGEWRCKCLQAALLYLLRSSPFLEDVEQSLLAACGNHSPSGALAGTLAITNARSAHTILQRFGCFIWVVRSQRAGGDTQGHGRWSFGDGAGSCAGSILWSDEDHHVFALQGDGLEELVLQFPDRSGHHPPPWE